VLLFLLPIIKVMNSTVEHFSYDDAIVRKFIIATLVWGFVGMLVGVVIASQLAYWPLNTELPWFSYGRLRPLHTNAVIFAFAGNAIFAGIYYSTQRLLKARMFSDALSAVHFWGWQLIIVSAAITLPLGITVSKEYAELEWPIDLAVTFIWVVFAVNLFGTLARRREKHIYVAVWFYIATVLTVAMLHVVNSLAIPVSFTKSYPVFAGVQDALVQWWYGHNAVAFFLTTPFLGLMYYFMPKAAERPIYSYRLSIVHFWSLVFLYIWAGPHHLLNTSLPEWAQTMGVVFSVTLIAPSWGGMINGLLTLRGAWDRLRTDTILKFFVTGITFYGMSTFEGPMMSIKAVNALSHYTDWTIGHVHGGALGWNGFITFGMIYWLIPRLWKIEVYSKRLMNLHFWIATVAIVLYMTSMWTSGITQGLMWKAFNADGTLQYPDFVETVTKIVPFYFVRFVAGVLYLTGIGIMLYNFWRSVAASKAARADLSDTRASAPRFYDADSASGERSHNWHHQLEGKALQFSIFTMVAVLIGGLFEIIPLALIKSPDARAAVIKPYTPLELEGRDIYIREGCYTCHSQMIRPFKDEAARYGPASESIEFVYDRPFQFGSKRTGPDLHRLGGKYPHFWHYKHMRDPRSTSSGSIMPAYPWLYTTRLDTTLTSTKLSVLRTLGTPYTDEEVRNAEGALREQAGKIVGELKGQQAPISDEEATSEIIALIAYLQRLGTDIKKATGAQ
jgi:cytochrome c oxidase cbb3-type subunit I/II